AERSPFRSAPLADSAPSAAGLLNSLEEYVRRASGGGREGEPRGPFKDDWNPLLYGTDVARAAEDRVRTPPISVVVFVTGDAPVDRG
ncbi:hypothetical protein, partial [Streptomyces sp. GbtcB7]